MERDARAYLWDVRQAAEAIGRFIVGLDATSYAGNALVRSAAYERAGVYTVIVEHEGYAVRVIIPSRLRYLSGTDVSVEDIDPIASFYAAVTLLMTSR